MHATGNPGCTLFNSECTISAGNTLRIGPGLKGHFSQIGLIMVLPNGSNIALQVNFVMAIVLKTYRLCDANIFHCVISRRYNGGGWRRGVVVSTVRQTNVGPGYNWDG